MKLKSLAKIALMLLTLLVVAPADFAQQTNSKESASSANITKEDDHLPFMKSEQAPGVQEPSSGGLLLKTIGAMLLVVGLLFFGAWGLKKVGFGNSKPNASLEAPELSIISSVSLGSGRTISTIRFGERVLVVGSTAQAFTLLADDTLNEGSDGSDEPLPAINPRSVADLLRDENISFQNELQLAQNRFSFLEEDGGRD